jgi:hypothetical protein
MLTWIIIIAVLLLLLFGGVGYGYRGSRYDGGGLGILGKILVVILLLWLLGALC